MIMSYSLWIKKSYFLKYLSEMGSKLSKVKGYIVIISCAAMFIFGILFISTIRSGSNNTNVMEHFFDWAIMYHSAGFVLFDQDLNNERSTLNTKYSLGFSTFGGLVKLTDIAIRRIFPGYENLLIKEEEGHQTPRVIGIDNKTGYPIWGNAFFTILYPIYKDFRILGIMFIPFILGIITGNNYLKARIDITARIIYMFLIFIMIFSIYNVPTDSNPIWLTFIIIIFVGNKIRLV